MINYTGNVTLDEPSTIGYRLWKLGHFHNPKYPTDVDPTDPDEAMHVQLRHPNMEAAVMSYMEWFALDLTEIVQRIHGRHLQIDGHAGPAFVELLNQPRCGYPDYMAAGRQEANWPDGCRRELIFGRSFASIRGLDEAGVDKAFRGAAYLITRALADVKLRSQGHGPRGQSRIYADAKRLSGSTLAWSYLARNTCNDVLAQAYNTSVDWNLRYLCTVATHEIGHAMGGPHVQHRDATMYPSIHQRSLARFGYFHTADLNMLQGIGYSRSGLSQPTEDEIFSGDNPDPPDPPDPPGPSKELYLKGTVTVVVDGVDWPQEFTFTKKPEA